MKTSLGSFSLYRQAKPTKRWKVPGVAEYDPNWVAYFFLGSKPIARAAKLYPVCIGCLKVEHGKNPVEVRPDCGCHKAAAKWARAFLDTQAELLRQGELEKLQELRTPKKWVSPKEVLKVYRERGPADRVQRLNFLSAMFEQTTGKDIDLLQWEDLTPDLKLNWAELRQEAGRRGWLGLGAGKNMPHDGWMKLREELVKPLKDPTRKLKALDTLTVAPWNTTISTYMTSINSIFGPKSRTNVLRGLNVPPLEEFLSVRISLPGPKGHKEIETDVMKRIDKALPKMLKNNERVWLFHQLCEETGMRPVSVRRLAGKDLQVLTKSEARAWRKKMAEEWRVAESELCDFGGLVKVPGAKGGNDVLTPVSVEVVAVAKQVMTDDSLVGAKHVTESRELHKELNLWLRECGVTGTHAAYLLRHRKGQQMRRFGGRKAVSGALGHKGEAMADRYSREDRVVPAVGLRKGGKAA